MPSSPHSTSTTWFGIVRCSDGIEIEGAVESWTGEHDFAQLLVVDDRGPVTWLVIPAERFSREYIIAQVAAELPAGRQQLKIHAGTLTIAICTRDRPLVLRGCLERIRRAVDNRYAVLVVDNAPTSDATMHIVEDYVSRGMDIHRVVEPRPGLARARNCALERSTTDFVAFTDDDALPDVNWPCEILRGFSAGENVALVTGLTPPAQIENVVQALFETKLKWSNNLLPECYSMVRQHEYSWPFPFAAGHFGTGANFAVHRQILLDLGGFDEALGAGMRTRGGEDLEIFVRVLRQGYELSYQPAAVVWHLHRKDETAARKLLFGYGVGLSAAMTAELLQPKRLEMIRGTLKGAWDLVGHRQDEIAYGMPWQHLILDIVGTLYGPLAYTIERFSQANRHRHGCT